MDRKVERVFDIFFRLNKGMKINKAEEAKRFNVSTRSIQRDMDDIRSYFSEHPEYVMELKYDYKENGFRLVRTDNNALTNSQILTVCKILVESRSLVKEEMFPIIDKLLHNCVPYDESKRVSELISNEKYHYLEPHHRKKFVETMWEISSAVYEHKLMRIEYQKLKETDKVMRLVQPVGIMFSEYYFYLCAYICASEEELDIPRHPFPTIYRIDRIARFEILNKHFNIPYADRFQEGEFRKRIQFMFGGELRRIKFLYKGISIEAVLDRFPTAEILSHDEAGWLITAEVYGNGVDMWLRGQGELVEVING